MHELVFRAEQFLILEAALLDERRFTDWLALYDEDAWYWAPVLPDATERGLALAHYDEDRTQMEARIKRLDQPTAYSEQPPARTCRLIGNVRILEQEGNGSLRVGSRLIMYEYRNRSAGGETRTIYASMVQHLLRPGDGTFSIGWKRVDLVDAEAGFFVASVPI
jgi:3-phenylpropionate/cinnamic acid dioxygenase small subunit